MRMEPRRKVSVGGPVQTGAAAAVFLAAWGVSLAVWHLFLGIRFPEAALFLFKFPRVIRAVLAGLIPAQRFKPLRRPLLLLPALELQRSVEAQAVVYAVASKVAVVAVVLLGYLHPVERVLKEGFLAVLPLAAPAALPEVHHIPQPRGEHMVLAAAAPVATRRPSASRLLITVAVVAAAVPFVAGMLAALAHRV